MYPPDKQQQGTINVPYPGVLQRLLAAGYYSRATDCYETAENFEFFFFFAKSQEMATYIWKNPIDENLLLEKITPTHGFDFNLNKF